MNIKFLLHKEKGKPSLQKQECGCPSVQSSFHNHTHAFSPTTRKKMQIINKKSRVY